MIFDRPSSIGELDGFNLILINFYIAALTPLLRCSEAAMNLS